MRTLIYVFKSQLRNHKIVPIYSAALREELTEWKGVEFSGTLQKARTIIIKDS